MVKKIQKFLYEIKKNPKNWHYIVDKLLQDYGLLSHQDWSNIETCFITSTGRTGTKFLANFFNEFDNIHSVHEPTPVFRDLSIEFAKGLCSSKKAKEEIKDKRRALCRQVKRNGNQIYIESNPRLFSLIKPLKEAFNEPKIIHIVRDGRDFVRSGMSRYYGGFYSKGDINPRLNAIDFPEDDYYDNWDDFSLFEKNCWYWKKRDEIIYQDIKDYSKGITIKFEDIFNRPEDYKGICEISQFLGLDNDDAISTFKYMQRNKINKTKKYSIPHWKEWDDIKKEKFDQIAGDHMKIYYNY